MLDQRLRSVDGTSVYDKTAGAYLADTYRRSLIGEAHLPLNGSTSSQRGYHWYSIIDNNTSGTGTGGAFYQDGQSSASWADSTADMTGDIDVELYLTFNTSHADNEFRLRSARLTIEPSI